MHVPCVIFDGKSEDFATEMFVIINSTPMRINKSHLVDLYERFSWAAPDKRFAARLVERLYTEGDSPLRYKINRLGDRSRQEKWILQAELSSELYKWALADWRQKRWERRLAPWSELLRSFRAEGVLRTLPRPGPGRACRAHPSRAGPRRAQRGQDAQGRGVAPAPTDAKGRD
jgi:hypothetical protein